MTQQSTIGRWLAGFSLAAIAAATLTPGAGDAAPLPALCVICGDYGGVDFVLNVFLFVPYGAGLYLLLRRPLPAAALASLTSLAVELLQLHIIPFRDASLGDLVSNTLGATVGILLSSTWRLWIFPPPALARRLSQAGLAAVLGLLAGTSWALRPSPTDARWYGQRAPELSQFGTFKGSLLAAALNGGPFPEGEIPGEKSARRELRGGRVTLDAVVTAGRRLQTGTLAPIASVFDANQHEIMLLGQEGVALTFRTRTHLSDLRLREPTVALPRIFPDYFPGKAIPGPGDGSRPGDTLHLHGSRGDGIVLLRAESPLGVRTREFPLNAFLGWSAILPFTLSLGTGALLISTLWAAALFFWPAYWSGFDPDRRWASLLLTAGLVAGLAFVPRIFGLPGTPWWGWAGSAAGWGSGWGTAGWAIRAGSNFDRWGGR